MKVKGYLTAKPLVIILFAFLLSSCYSYKSISRNEPITKEHLSNLYVGGKYAFDLKIGQTLDIEITGIKADSITGVMYQRGIDGALKYSESFETIERNVARISYRKRSITLTVFAIAVPATLTIGFIAHSMNSWYDSF